MLQFPADATFSTLAVTAFVAGAIGSPHCAAMCGPLVVACSRDVGGGSASGNSGRFASFTLQQFGRFLAYITLGALAATFGNAIDGVAARDGARIVPLAIGGVLVAFGFVELLASLRRPASAATDRHSGKQRGSSWLNQVRSALSRLAARVGRVSARAPRPLRPLLLGGVSALLPCGLLHAVTFGAAGARSPIEGAALLAAFFCGTLPALALVAIGAAHWSSSRFGFVVAPLRGIALIGAGVALVVMAQSGASCCHGS